MPGHQGHLRLLSALAGGLLAGVGLSSCSPSGPPREQAQVTQAFDAWKSDVINHRIDQAMAYIPRDVDPYLKALNSAEPAPTAAPQADQSPGVDLLLRTALAEKVPADLRSRLTLGTLWERISERHLLNPRDVREIDLGHVSVNGDRANAELYYEGTLKPMRLPFIKEGDVWKIDVMAILSYAEVLMRVDRAIKGETENQQVAQLVSKIPSL